MISRSSYWLSHAIAFWVLIFGALPVEGDADFESVRIRTDYEYMGGSAGDPVGKYWHESVFHPHYDGRFTNKTLPYEEQRTNLTLLMQSYLFSMADLGAETWIIHGTLLGWWWNRKIMPWDSDIDVQMTWSTMHFLASYYNMTIHSYEKRDYLLEINPRYVDGSYKDKLNVIDGRWIDIHTGLFIDITAIRLKKGTRDVLATKDQHEEKAHDLFPLRDSLFQGLPVKIPYNYARLLTQEYGKAALTKTDYSDHTFNTTSMQWVKKPQVPLVKFIENRLLSPKPRVPP